MRIPTLTDFNDLLDATESVLSDDAVAKVLADSGCDLGDDFAVISALVAHAIRPTQVEDLQNAVRLAKRRRTEERADV